MYTVLYSIHLVLVGFLPVNFFYEHVDNTHAFNGLCPNPNPNPNPNM